MSISISHGLSLGLFIVACVALGTVFSTIAVSTILQVVMIRKGEMRFIDASQWAQHIYLILFPGDGDAGGHA